MLGFFDAQVAQHAHAVELGQVQVEDDDVVLELGCRGPGLFAIRENIHRVMFAFETLANEFGQRFIIFCDKNSHNLNRP